MSSFLPNVVQLGWGGDNGWGTSIIQTIYMTVWPAIIGGLIGLIFGSPSWSPNRWNLGKQGSLQHLR